MTHTIKFTVNWAKAPHLLSVVTYSNGCAKFWVDLGYVLSLDFWLVACARAYACELEDKVLVSPVCLLCVSLGYVLDLLLLN